MKLIRIHFLESFVHDLKLRVSSTFPSGVKWMWKSRETFFISLTQTLAKKKLQVFD